MQNRYSVDDYNRLCIFSCGKMIPIAGSFEADKSNRLIYWLNVPAAWRRKYNLPGKIVFTGRWKIDENHDLSLELKAEDKAVIQQEPLTLKGEIISAESDKLIFEVASVNKFGLTHIRLLKLSGAWFADELNRISFTVKKQNGSSDVLTFVGAWQVNKNQELTYFYQKTNLKTKTKTLSTLTFGGFWKITSGNQLSYVISADSSSKFDFRVYLETPNIYPQKGVVKYRVGIGTKGRKENKLKTITLYGAWKINYRLGLDFEMEYEKGRFHALEFGADINLNKDNKVIFSLRNNAGNKLGINVIFTHSF